MAQLKAAFDSHQLDLSGSRMGLFLFRSKRILFIESQSMKNLLELCLLQLLIVQDYMPGWH